MTIAPWPVIGVRCGLVVAGITARARGTVAVSYRSAGRTTRFTAPISNAAIRVAGGRDDSLNVGGVGRTSDHRRIRVEIAVKNSAVGVIR